MSTLSYQANEEKLGTEMSPSTHKTTAFGALQSQKGSELQNSPLMMHMRNNHNPVPIHVMHNLSKDHDMLMMRRAGVRVDNMNNVRVIKFTMN